MDKSGTGPGKAKQRILTAAARLFRRQGFARTTVRELADEVGILSGSLFHHFSSKDDILHAVMDQVITDMDASLAAALARARTPRDKLRALFHVQLDFLHGAHSDASAVLVYEWGALPADRQAQLLVRRQRYFDRWTEVLAQAHRADLTGIDPDILRQLLHGATAWTAHWFDPDGPVSLTELETALVSMATRGAGGDA